MALSTLVLVLGGLFVAVAPAHASAPVVLSGASWFGGDGSNVCSRSTDPYCGSEYKLGSNSSNWWQCVELVQRFYTKMGWRSGAFGVSYAYQIYDNASSLGMTRQANGSIVSILPGDLIIHASSDPGSGGAGHVAIVDTVNGQTVSVVEQNGPTANGRATYIWSNGSLSRGGAPILGVVHDPDNNIAVSQNNAFVTSVYQDNEKHVFSVDSSGTVRETWWTANGPESGPITSISGQPTGIASFIAGTYRHVYVSTLQGPVYEIYWASGVPVSKWQIANVPNNRGVTAVLNNGEKSIFTIDTAGVVHETWWVNGSPQTGPIADVTSNTPTGISAFIAGTYRHVYVSTSEGPLTETYWAPGVSATTWQIASVPQAVGTAAIFNNGEKSIFTTSASGVVHETWWVNGSPQSGSITDVGDVQATGASAFIAGGYRHVYTSTAAGAILETYWSSSTPASTWQVN